MGMSKVERGVSDCSLSENKYTIYTQKFFLVSQQTFKVIDFLLRISY